MRILTATRWIGRLAAGTLVTVMAALPAQPAVAATTVPSPLPRITVPGGPAKTAPTTKPAPTAAGLVTFTGALKLAADARAKGPTFQASNGHVYRYDRGMYEAWRQLYPGGYPPSGVKHEYWKLMNDPFWLPNYTNQKSPWGKTPHQYPVGFKVAGGMLVLADAGRSGADVAPANGNSPWWALVVGVGLLATLSYLLHRGYLRARYGRRGQSDETGYSGQAEPPADDPIGKIRPS